MCFCPRPASDSLREAHQIQFLKCGTCPECLQERSASWVLRCYGEAKTRRALGESVCMVTLTYDQYLRDDHGRVLFDRFGNPLEVPPDKTKLCNKRDVQLFMKRLRFRFSDSNIKYLISAEHGSHTHRAHYHALLFGVSFPDLLPYKKSSRGNQIFKSKILNELWKHGICTVDSVVSNPAISRYVTKYSMKSRGCDDTFQLFSHGLGEEWLLQNFTGRPYIIEGRSYPVPRTVWEKYILLKYSDFMQFSPRYICKDDPRYRDSLILRQNYRAIRNSDPVYIEYLLHQRELADAREEFRPPEFQRVLALDDKKYHFYREKWLKAYQEKFERSQHSSRLYAVTIDPNASEASIRSGLLAGIEKNSIEYRFSGASFAVSRSCHNTANDSLRSRIRKTLSLDEKIQENFFQILDKRTE